MPYYEMKFNPSDLISDLAQATIGRRPIITGRSGTHLIQIEFDPDLTPAERIALKNALPGWMKKLWTFTKETGTLQSP